MTTTTNTPPPSTRDESIAEARARLAAQVAAIQTSDDWKRWLHFSAKFHTYSFNNVLLIMSQRPDAQQCASYTTWKSMGRQVNGGERGIKIFAPIIVKRDADELKANPTLSKTKLVGFKVVRTFDISQTSGPSIDASPTVTLLQGEGPAGVLERIEKLISDRGFVVGHRDIGGSMNGYTDFTTNTVVIKDSLSGLQMIKTAIHELAHVMLHAPTDDLPARFCREDAEVEAESVAFIVCDFLGIKSDDYSFGYVAGWSSKDPTALERSGNRITSATKKIIHALDEEN